MIGDHEKRVLVDNSEKANRMSSGSIRARGSHYETRRSRPHVERHRVVGAGHAKALGPGRDVNPVSHRESPASPLAARVVPTVEGGNGSVSSTRVIRDFRVLARQSLEPDDLIA